VVKEVTMEFKTLDEHMGILHPSILDEARIAFRVWTKDDSLKVVRLDDVTVDLKEQTLIIDFVEVE
jgi:hypothetical protein